MASDLSHLADIVEGQDRGTDLVIKHPVTGEPMPDLVLVVAGPDSDTARRARLQFEDEKFAYAGRPPASEIDRMYVDLLARLVVDWRVLKDGQPVDFSFTAVVRALTKFQFMRDQVEAFSQNRAPYFMRLKIEDPK